MTVEELDIVVQASVKQALKEFKKLLPEIKKQLSGIQKEFDKINIKDIAAKVDMKSVEKQAKEAAKKVKDAFDPNDTSGMKINGLEYSIKQIKGYSKEIQKFKAQAGNLNKINVEMPQPKIAQVPNVSRTKNTIQDTGSNSVNQYSAWTNALRKYYAILDMAKAKMYELKQETNQAGTSQNRLTSFFSRFKQKIGQAKTSVKGLTSSFNQIPKITQKITNNIKGMGSGLKLGLKHVLKYAMALFSLRGIYSVLSNSARSWLSSQNSGAQQLSANIDYLKYSMGSVLAPIIENITNLIYKLMKAIQSVVYAFSGINIFAKTTASSMNKTAGSASKASKSLAGVHSEINNVSENNNSGESGTTSPSIDLSQMDNQMNGWADKFKEKLLTLFQPIQNSWSTYGQPLIQSIKNAFQSNLGLIKSIGKSFEEIWFNGTGEQTVNIILQTLISIFNICGNIGSAFKQAWENSGGIDIVQSLWNGFNNLLEIVKEVYEAIEEWTASQSFQTFANSIIGICRTLSGWFETITAKIKEIWDNGGKTTFAKILEYLSKLYQAIDTIIRFLDPAIKWVINSVTPVITGIVKALGYVIDALSGVLDFIIGVFTGNWEKAWQGIKEFFEGIWNALKTIVETVINFIKNIISTVLSVIKTIWLNIWGGIKTFFSNLWESIKSIVSNVINGIKNTISNVLNTISTIWSNIWNGLKTIVTNIFDGIWNAIKGVINSILGGIEGMANGVVKGVNLVIRALNRLHFDIPDWVPALGGKTFGFNINELSMVSLPRLAKGNVAYSPMIAQFGEYSGASTNPEITTPQNIMAETFREEMSDFFASNNANDRPINLNVYVGNNKLGQILLEDLRDMTRRTGKDIEALVGG